MIEWKPLWDVNQRQSDVVKSARCSHVPEVANLATSGCCEFVGSLVDATSNGRYCCDHTFCPARIYSDIAVFQSCPTRSEKLKAAKEEKT